MGLTDKRVRSRTNTVTDRSPLQISIFQNPSTSTGNQSTESKLATLSNTYVMLNLFALDTVSLGTGCGYLICVPLINYSPELVS